MGLHFYRNPDEVDAENAAAKLDRAAAQRRSTIRREPSIRSGRDQSSSSGLTNIIRNRNDMQRARLRLQRETQAADAHIARLEEELEQLRRQRERNSVRFHNEQARARLARRIGSTANIPDSPVTDDVMLTINENELTRHDESAAEHVLLPRPNRESNLRFEVAATPNAIAFSPQRRAWGVPSPPHSLSDSSRIRPVDGPLDTWGTTPPLTQGFAPAQAARAPPGQVVTPPDSSSDDSRNADLDERNGLETPPAESWLNSYPPLRRVPHMSPRPLPRSDVDGLGDRHRSASPSEPHEEATWNTLLSTIDNSNTPSSASTSFASATDLLGASRSSSYRSSNTITASTSFGEIGTTAEDTCELPPGITEDDVRQIRERYRRYARRVTAPRRHIPEPEYDDDEQGHSPRDPAAHDMPLPRSRTEVSRERSTRRVESTALQAIMERMQRHEAIPEDMWELAGLPPDFGRTHLDL